MHKLSHWGVVVVGMIASVPASAIERSFDVFGERADMVFNNTVTFGASWRMEKPANDLIGKGNLDPTVCAGVYQSCQGLQRTQVYPAQKLAAAPGAPSINFDDGNLNYDQWDMTQAPLKLSQDIRVQWGNYGVFVRGIGIYDPLNYNHFKTHSPNKVTAANVGQVGITDDPEVSNRYVERVYGAGADLREIRDGREAREIGLRYDLLDANFFGRIPYADGDKELMFRIGRQVVNWGQSTVAVVNSVNQAQPVNANSLYRLGFGLLEELFVPVGMVSASTEILEGLTMEAYYQFEWAPIEIPTPGSFMSFVDVGTDNKRMNVNAAFGGSPDDPDRVARPLDNPLTLITYTTLNVPRLEDKQARNSGQYGVSFKFYSDEINNGTEFGFYAMNYHSKLPYASFFATEASCARAEGNPFGLDASNTLEFLKACPNMPVAQTTGQVGNSPLLSGLLDALTQSLLGGVNPNLQVNGSQILVDFARVIAASPTRLNEFGVINPANLPGLFNALLPNASQPKSSAVPFDSARLRLEYPEDIHMVGIDFTTTFGDYSYQGEISYRPNVPLQVSLIDLAFASFGPTLTRCHDASTGCQGAQTTIGFTEAGTYEFYHDNDFVDASGNNPYADTVSLAIGAAPGSARSFPNFIMPYRGVAVGETAPKSYIQGWIPGKVLQYNLGATRVLGASENWIAADQVALIYEVAATHVLNMPKFDELQIEGPMAATTHASAGADGTGADGSRLACSTNPACSFGADGLRFNPTQASRRAFADAFSWGYRVVGRILYESVLPGVSIRPLFIFWHDINGNSPGPAGNFVGGRKQFNFLLETSYEKAFSFTIAYNNYWGAGSNNVYRDRSNIGFFFKVQF
ncbi:DUF1302 domain-containing protein [Sinimarinibacterium sp. NLF-5-8]|uniref:DUF1302 domain-containing protein n=1 Tax=Sinimarinibacterium sp. NLF-5-8 TaxID=2698684 RepID=UPI00137C11C3|nr:DUF1302 family protein [Sinimarinibacterium sp. NLF-5-8]QHS10451.1 DUF1302 domain-containing protein [Sinimarinibacterium sp. NLF-5-8]